MKRMNCKLQVDGKDCGVLIDYDADTKTATEVNTGQKHIHAKPKAWTKKEFKPQENDLSFDAINSEIKALWETVTRLDETLRGVIKEVTFKTGDEV